MRRLFLATAALGLALFLAGEPAAHAEGVVSLAPCPQTYCALPTVTVLATSGQVLKAAPGNGYRYAVNAGALAGWLMIFDSTTVPGDGATGASLKICSPVPANSRVEIDHSTLPDKFLLGIAEAFSTNAAGCANKTAAAPQDLEGQVSQ